MTIEQPLGAQPAGLQFFTALMDAQKDVRGLVADSRNSHFNYDYVSSEQMIIECRAVLHARDLLLMPVSSKVLPMETLVAAATQAFAHKGKENLATRIASLLPTRMTRGYVLVHVPTLQSQSFTQDWMLNIENGRGPDKANGAGATASLSYFLRDLLLIPRVNHEDDLNSVRGDPGDDGDDFDDGPHNHDDRPSPKAALLMDIAKLGNQLNLDAGNGDYAEWCQTYGDYNTPKEMPVEALEKLKSEMTEELGT